MGYRQVISSEFHLEKPFDKESAVLILFGGYPESVEDVKREFDILEKAMEKNIAILYLAYNQKLWFDDGELDQLASQLQMIFNDNQLTTDDVYIGGFSSGGVVTALLSNYLVANDSFKLKPKGVFIIDSPIDLAELYFSSAKNLKRKFSETSMQESIWLIDMLGNRFGNPNEDISQYEAYSVFTFKTGEIANVTNLKDTKIRLYTEPDSLWWKENRMADFDQTNAFLIQNFSEKLKAAGFRSVEYIPTQNKGYRANGDRHPHSWSIVDQDNLIKWIMGTKAL